MLWNLIAMVGSWAIVAVIAVLAFVLVIALLLNMRDMIVKSQAEHRARIARAQGGPNSKPIMSGR